jgi:6-phosphogluconate dehydrogenase
MNKMNDIAILGMGVMGKSMAINILKRRYDIAVYDEHIDPTLKFAGDKKAQLHNFTDMGRLILSLAKPRKIFVTTGAKDVDKMIEKVKPYLDKGDTIIDGSDSYYFDSKRRGKELKALGIRYLDIGIAGARQSIVDGAGLTVGGETGAYGSCSRMLRQISKEHNNYSCCILLGPHGAGHFTKMVHDSIEYAIMQMIAESYFLLRKLGNMSCEEISASFNFMNENRFSSYLLDVTAQILEKIDAETGKPIIDLIMDKVRHNGAGKAAVHESLEFRVPMQVSAEAVYFRYLSTKREVREQSSKKLVAPVKKYDGDKYQLVDNVRDALYASMVVAYSQGFDLIKECAEFEEWTYGIKEVANIWSGSSTIKSKILEIISDAYNSEAYLASVMHYDNISKALKESQNGWRNTVCIAAKHCVSTPAIMSALSYYDGMCSYLLPANLIQAQRNFLGKDTVNRYDRQGDFDISW